MNKSKLSSRIKLKPGKQLFLLTLPFLILVFLFSYLPLAGWSYAFFEYRPGISLADLEFVGLKYFLILIQDSHAISEMIRVMTNTFAMSFLTIIGSIFPVMFAVLLNEVRLKMYRRTVQTLMTLPHFISWVLIFSVVWSMFSVGDGFVNRLLLQMGAIDRGINFMGSSNNVWITQWIYAMWKSLVWSMIIYLAAIAGIDQELYEAARIDGAGRFKTIIHIVVPALMPTFFVLLLLTIANFLNNGMEQYLIFSNPMNKASIEVLDLYVYNQGLLNARIPFATAIGVLKSVVSVVLLFTANLASKLVRGESIF